ncbi:MAG: MarR family transcriptional regulator [Gemmatimonadetes bacterium]|nr:MAG: MarR family transcriptional regulator [Gemmatimonadota bacterium]PYO99819.1 MAG: MarR family transcriptional regulator [Gemmatimonadota bacterium]TLY53841.1 MAG: MarR family transcriptional regulator [Gemmatimonadota bacterium]
MKLLDQPSTRAPTAAEVAALVLNAAQLVVRLARAEVRRQHPGNLSLTQLRALDYLSADPDASLSAVADYVGLTLPSTSVLIDGLAGRGLVARRAAPGDRRRLRLRLTAAGNAGLRTVLVAARAAVADRLKDLAPRDRALITRAMARISAAAAPTGHAARSHRSHGR